jgi:hypothetical protein
LTTRRRLWSGPLRRGQESGPRRGRGLSFPPWLFDPQPPSELPFESPHKRFLSKRQARISCPTNRATTRLSQRTPTHVRPAFVAAYLPLQGSSGFFQVQHAPAISTCRVRNGARPRMRWRISQPSRPHRMQVHIGQCPRQMVPIQRAGEKPPLPKMSAARVLPMEPLRPPRVTALQAARKGVRALWHPRQMNVMRHQAPAKQPDSVAAQSWASASSYCRRSSPATKTSCR